MYRRRLLNESSAVGFWDLNRLLDFVRTSFSDKHGWKSKHANSTETLRPWTERLRGRWREKWGWTGQHCQPVQKEKRAKFCPATLRSNLHISAKLTLFQTTWKKRIHKLPPSPAHKPILDGFYEVKSGSAWSEWKTRLKVEKTGILNKKKLKMWT